MEASTGTSRPAAPAVAAANGLRARLLSVIGEPPHPFVVELPDGSTVGIGEGPPAFRVRVHRPARVRELLSLHQLRIADAYIAGDLDIDGDLLAALALKDRISDRTPWLKLWRRLAPRVFGRERFNPAWIAKHYDAGNIQLEAADRDYNTYTPGIYVDEHDTLEAGAERKLATAFEALRLKPGRSLLDIGCGWGGFLRYAARRAVHVTGITLSRHQFEYDRRLIEDERLPAEVVYEDFFAFEPGRRFDAISMMGVMEDLSDYPRVVARIANWLRPGGRVYLDFATARSRFATGSFVTTHVWPGTFRMVYLPELMEALVRSPFELVALHDDRHNYHLWSKTVHERWVERREQIVARVGERLWRTYRLLYAGCATIMTRPSGSASACRMILELPSELTPGS